jgi:hypothetical protein
MPKPTPVMPAGRNTRWSVADHRAGPPAGIAPLDVALLGLVFLAFVAMLSLPAARAPSATFGWTGFWLLAGPASAWLGLQLSRVFAAPRARSAGHVAIGRRTVPAALRRRGRAARRIARHADVA